MGLGVKFRFPSLTLYIYFILIKAYSNNIWYRITVEISNFSFIKIFSLLQYSILYSYHLIAVETKLILRHQIRV